MPTPNAFNSFIMSPQPKIRSKYAREVPAKINLGELSPSWLTSTKPNLKEPVNICVSRCDGHLVSPSSEILGAAHSALKAYKASHMAQYGGTLPTAQKFAWRAAFSPATGLPAYVRGRLKMAPTDLGDAPGRARTWLTDPQLTKVLLGLALKPGSNELVESDAAFSQHFPKPPETITWEPQVIADAAKAINSLTLNPRYHVRYQQWHGDWPVFGGAIVVHMSKDDSRISCTNAYLPVPPQTPITVDPGRLIGEKAAIAQAQRALQHYVSPPAKVSKDTAAMVEMMPSGPAAPASAAADLKPGETMAPQPVATIGASQFVRIGNRVAFLPAVPPLQWRGEVRRYADSACVLLPFARSYRLAYEVRLTNPELPETWSVWVEAITGEVLDRPANLSCFAPYYGTSQEVLNGAPSGNAAQPETLCADFMPTIKVFNPAGGERDPVWNSAATNGLDFEAINVAVHASEMCDHLVSLGVKREKFQQAQRRLRANINAGLTNFDPGIGSASDATINFQHDVTGNGLPGMESAGDTKQVHNPAFDPEVIYHEAAHGLLWMLNPDPFEHWVEVAPFARALVEGYANYFARSLGARIAGDTGATKTHWAKSAYQPGEWNDAWAFALDSWDQEQEALAGPNLYPRVAQQSLEVYDIGMIWARLLWDLRELVGWELADRAALNAYFHAQGWVAGFEPVAEGLLELLDLVKEVRAVQDVATADDALQPLLAYRRIVAQRGIQAMAAVNNMILVGADAGLVRSNDGGTTWQAAELTDIMKDGKVQPLTDVIAIAPHRDAGGNVIAWYAATEGGMFRWEAADPRWRTVPGWQVAGRPLAMTCEGTTLCVTSTAGVQKGALPPGASLTDLSPLPGGGLPLNVAISPTIPEPTLYIAGVSALLIRPPSGNWTWHPPADPETDLVTCVAVTGNSVFVGTATQGVCESDQVGHFSDVPQRQGRRGLKKAAVLSLVVNSNNPLTLFAGTTMGVYRGTRTPQNVVSWVKFGQQWPDGAAATCVAVTQAGLLAGTAFHGLWMLPGSDPLKLWMQVDDNNVRSLGGPQLPKIGSAGVQSCIFSAAATENEQGIYLFPFQIACAGRMSVQTAPPNGAVQVFRLRPNVVNIPLTNQPVQVEADFYAVQLRGVLQNSVTITVRIV